MTVRDAKLALAVCHIVEAYDPCLVKGEDWYFLFGWLGNVKLETPIHPGIRRLLNVVFTRWKTCKDSAESRTWVLAHNFYL